MDAFDAKDLLEPERVVPIGELELILAGAVGDRRLIDDLLLVADARDLDDRARGGRRGAPVQMGARPAQSGSDRLDQFPADLPASGEAATSRTVWINAASGGITAPGRQARDTTAGSASSTGT